MGEIRFLKDIRSPADLPATIPVFPLAGALVLPRGKLPLNIFEPRYLAMVRDAMAGNRLIGMIQPRDGSVVPELHAVGCLAYIAEWTETIDGRYLITLTGVSRFTVAEELMAATLYRQIRADYTAFASDFEEEAGRAVDREAIGSALRRYLGSKGLSADWEAVQSANAEALVNSLACLCPFDPVEKQALLEAPDLTERAKTLLALLEMGIAQHELEDPDDDDDDGDDGKTLN